MSLESIRPRTVAGLSIVALDLADVVHRQALM